MTSPAVPRRAALSTLVALFALVLALLLPTVTGWASAAATGWGTSPTSPVPPTPTGPGPTGPAPTGPAPTGPAPTDPGPTGPVPTDPAPTNPEPTATDPEPTGAPTTQPGPGPTWTPPPPAPRPTPTSPAPAPTTAPEAPPNDPGTSTPPVASPAPVKVPIPERGLMLGRGLAAVGLTVGTVEVLSAGGTSTEQTSATGVAGQDVAPTTNDATPSGASSPAEVSPSREAASVAEPQAGTAPDNGSSGLLIVIAISAALGAAVLGWFGWRSR